MYPLTDDRPLSHAKTHVSRSLVDIQCTGHFTVRMFGYAIGENPSSNVAELSVIIQAHKAEVGH
jgi:hypothetical protein